MSKSCGGAILGAAGLGFTGPPGGHFAGATLPEGFESVRGFLNVQGVMRGSGSLGVDTFGK
ncbi:exported hypothetical protein [Nostocoides japonicum T1-X7]|uniref:Uncharacterized protein n=1 Tax=Nostocoides japonicum T1-X7 TaxID=1194083 RepID=A0A077M867_9MICO|nr:exported hypothetical protein [Tetrasphaera japonica T1-X7]